MSKRTGDLLATILNRSIIFLTLLFLVAPLAVTLVMAFDDRPYLGPLPPPSYSLRWFREFFADATFQRGLAVSLTLAVFAAVISTLIGVAAACALDRGQILGSELLSTLFLSPLAVPPVVTGFALLLFLAKLGLYAGFYRLICGHIIITIPYTIRASVAGFAAIDKSLTEAALVLGATTHRAFWDITLPLARTGIISGAIFAFAVSMDDVAVSIMLTDANTYTLPVALISSMRANFSLAIAAASLMLLTLTAILIFVLEKTVGVNRALGEGMFR
jgi:putative spermidine/putrescine transport system permease protein